MSEAGETTATAVARVPEGVLWLGAVLCLVMLGLVLLAWKEVADSEALAETAWEDGAEIAFDCATWHTPLPANPYSGEGGD